MSTAEKKASEQFKSIFSKIQSVIVGGEEASVLILVAILARGHVLIEDIPGVGKTLLAHSLARATNLGFSRIQCTPDILPSDIVGFSLYDINTGLTKYMKGAIMSNIVLVDEINRASPKSQSCFLEVMEEYQTTVDGVTHKVPLPFTVIATKADKISRGARMRHVAMISRALQVQPWEIIPWSSETGDGRDAVLAVLDAVLAGAAGEGMRAAALNGTSKG